MLLYIDNDDAETLKDILELCHQWDQERYRLRKNVLKQIEEGLKNYVQ